MAEQRADRILRCLRTYSGGRARVQQLLERIRDEEGNSDLSYQSVYIAIQQKNQHLEELGERPIFRTSREGEKRGWVRLHESSDFAKGSAASELETRILKTNEGVGDKIRTWLQKMNWRIFESTFLARILEALGFQEVLITQPTRDGGADARVTYRRGIVEARAIVSAKRWSTRSVGLDEVQRLRGLKGDEDTAIIVTTGQFTPDAEKEAKPGQNQRVVYLIDGDQLIDICTRNKIGVTKVSLPELLVLDEELTDGTGVDEASAEDQSSELEDMLVTDDTSGKRRLRDEMLGDSEKGLTFEEVAELSGLALSTVRVYLSDHRRKVVGQRIRADEHARARALRIISSRRPTS